MTIYLNPDNDFKCQLDINIEESSEYKYYILFLPFPTDEIISFHEKDIIYTWDNKEDLFTIFIFVIPPKNNKINMELVSKNIIQKSSLTNEKKILLDFNYQYLSKDMNWLLSQDYCIKNISKIRIGFPITINQNNIENFPRPSIIQGRFRTYEYINIVKNDNLLSISYPDPLDVTMIYAESMATLIIGVSTAIYTYLYDDEEKIKTKNIFSWCIIFVLWLGAIIVGYFWLTIGSWPINKILPYFLPIIINAIIILKWVKILKN